MARSRLLGFVLVLLTNVSLFADTSAPAVFEKSQPENLQELKEIQKHVQELTKKLIPCTVGLQIGNASGSGVIIDKEGHVLTAGHVSGKPGQPVTIILHTGKKIKGKSLGANQGIDSGMVEITEKGDFPFVEMGTSADLKKGQWCLALGHPGGYHPGRSPVLRLGRILENGKFVLRTDCTLVGGDSGGPLFDVNGKVIGIHSRIGQSISTNLHVPVDTYRETWDRLVASESWGPNIFGGGNTKRGYLGVTLDTDASGCKIKEVTAKSPADNAGLKIGDVIVSLDGKKMDNTDDLSSFLGNKRSGTEVAVQILRGSETLSFKVTLGKRPQ